MFLLFFASLLFAQKANISGVVTSAKTGETLPGVNIIVQSGLGTVSDVNGKYSYDLEPGKYSIQFSFIGYSVSKKQINVTAGENKVINTQLNEESKLLDIVVVSGSAYEKKIKEEIVSIDVIKPYLIQNTNALDISEAIEKVPGVKVIDGQVSIRSGSGFSYGTGSRVQVIVDGQSYLSPDLGDVKWKLVPVDNIEQVEVIKGASSVLYGSSSMNGVINILTAWPSSEPETNIKFYQGFFLKPKRKELAWWDRESEGVHMPSFSGLSVLHKQKLGQFDVVAGIDGAFVNSYLKEIDDYRFGLYFKTRYRAKKIEGLSYGISGNILYDQVRRFMFFDNANEGGYMSSLNTTAADVNFTIAINPFLNYFTPRGTKHLLRLMYFNVISVKFDDYNRLRENTPANVLILSYQIQKKLRKKLTLTSGIDGSYGWVKNNYFFEGFIPKTFYGALFTQLEQKFGRATILTGLRYEIYGLTGIKGIDPSIYGNIDYNTIIEPSKPILRAGINYMLSRTTNARLSFGQAYRFPALSERFLDNSIGDLNVFANPNLEPEKGWNLEGGIKQEIIVGTWKGYADLALFWMEYRNFINYTFGKWKDGDATDIGNYGFKALNISNARISGFEFSIMEEGTIFNIPIKIYGGYTFTYPGDLQSDTAQRHIGKYLSNLFESMAGIDTNKITSLLTYRNRHAVRLDIEAEYKKIGLGVSLIYNSSVERIDDYYALFDLIIDGISTYTKVYNSGTLLLDLRLSYRIKDKARISLIIKNLTNIEYSDRPGLIGPPRNIALQCVIKL